MRILYVEDNPTNRLLVQRIARLGGHEVLNYTNGETALENFDRDKPDLVLMDVQLEGALTGLDVVRSLRAAGHMIPMIAVTAYAMVGDRERCLEAGCNDYLAKPLSVSELVTLFERYGKETAASTPQADLRTESKAAPAPAGAAPPNNVPLASRSMPAPSRPAEPAQPSGGVKPDSATKSKPDPLPETQKDV